MELYQKVYYVVFFTLITTIFLFLTYKLFIYIKKIVNYRKKAYKGIAKYEFLYGLAYYYLPFFKKFGKSKAVYWLQKACKKENISAINKLSSIYMNDSNDIILNIDYLSNLFEKNILTSESQYIAYKLSLIYGLDILSIHDYKKSAFFMEKSSFLGNINAQFTLGLMYNEGIGIEQNNIIAYGWFLLAEENGIFSYDSYIVNNFLRIDDIIFAEMLYSKFNSLI